MDKIKKGFINSKSFNDAMAAVKKEDYSEVQKGVEAAAKKALDFYKNIKEFTQKK